jgi:hypothetical protein
VHDLPFGQLLVSSTNNIVRWVRFAPAAVTTNHAEASRASAAAESCGESSKGADRYAERAAAPQGSAVLHELAQCCTGRQPRVVAAALMVARGLLVVGDVSGGVCAFAIPARLRPATHGGWTNAACAATAPILTDASDALDACGPFVELHMIAKLGNCHNNTPVTMVRCLRDRVHTGGRNGARPRAHLKLAVTPCFKVPSLCLLVQYSMFAHRDLPVEVNSLSSIWRSLHHSSVHTCTSYERALTLGSSRRPRFLLRSTRAAGGGRCTRRGGGVWCCYICLRRG